jgi:predicted GIY-YIG superfamily endonuclease
MAQRSRLRAVAYVIRNAAGAVYVGTSTDFPGRLRRHNEGGGHPFTKHHPGPWEAVHIQPMRNIRAAQELEQTWTNHLRATGTLPFITFAVTTYGPHVHGDGNVRETVALKRRENRPFDRRPTLDDEWDH